MSSAGRVSAVVVFFVLVLIGLVFQNDSRQLTQSSYGAIPAGHGILYDTLEELELPVSRSFARMERLPATATLWWIEPPRLLGIDEPSEAPTDAEESAEPEPPATVPEEPAEETEESSVEDEAREQIERGLRRFRRETVTPAVRDLAGAALADWIEAGGTAVVFLGVSPGSLGELRVADVAVPERDPLVLPEASGLPSPEHDPLGTAGIPGKPAQIQLRGSLLPASRTVALDRPVAFAETGDGWTAVAWANGQPFALERRLGEGRLVVVADARFLSNRLLPRADAAPLALDFVRAYGVPRIDERSHGFSASRGVITTLAASPAAFCFAGLGLCGMVFAWLGGSLPRRSVGDAALPAPTLEGYVNAMADYYGATREYSRVLERYRDLSGRRLRRALALPPDAPLERVVERAARSRRADPEEIELLARGAPARDHGALVQAARKLDQMVRRIAS